MKTKLTSSLVVPMFNEARFIPKLLASVRASSMQPDEIILCDNGSTDNTIAIAKKHGKGLPIRIVHEKRKGILFAVDHAWRSAKGDIILKADADSILPPRWIANCMRHFNWDPKLMGLTGPLMGADGHKGHRWATTIASAYPALILSVVQGYPLLLGANSAYRRSALRKVNGYAWPRYDLDDHIISRKFSEAGLKSRWFWDTGLYHSTRRYHGKPKEYLASILTLFHPRFYHEK
jgi:cellulose synthase/poly-beta-1,6-N-acetylglucosamine synthase-like glycosyltransferase